MNILIRTLIIGLSILLSWSLQGGSGLSTSIDTLKTNLMPNNDEMIVAYYGRPDVHSLGILGQHSLEDLIPIVNAKVEEYKQASGNNNIIPGFDIIYGLAAADPGRRGDYILPLSSKKLMKYINAANEHGFAVFIDLQLGKMTPLEAVQPILKYLKYDNVHIAIDPEFEVHGLDVRPGKVIGKITGEDVNQVQAAMHKYMQDNSITDKKILVVHMFRASMVRNKNMIKDYDNIDIVMNLDGHGSPKLKVNIYNAIYTHAASMRAAAGFKLFFNEDKPSLMTPREVLGLDAVHGGVQMNYRPKFINYQ